MALSSQCSSQYRARQAPPTARTQLEDATRGRNADSSTSTSAVTCVDSIALQLHSAMNRVVADDVSTADVLWCAAERIGKSTSSDDIQRICDYLVNKHWFQTAGDLRTAQLAANEWHALQIPSRLKIAVQHVLDEVQCATPNSSAYDDYTGDYDSTVLTETPSHASAYDAAEGSYESYYYDYYTHDPASMQYRDSEPHPSQQYSSSVPDASTAADAATDGSGSVVDSVTTDSVALSATAESVTQSEVAMPPEQDVSSDEYRRYYHEHHASELSDLTTTEPNGDVVAAHAVDVEAATTYDAILAPLPPEWRCRQCTFLNALDDAFCAMCYDHISLSPDMANVPFVRAAVPAIVAPQSSCAAEMDRTTVSTSVASTRTFSTFVSPTMSPLYAPSAPPFDDDDDATVAIVPAAVESRVQPAQLPLPPPPAPVLSSATTAKQLAFRTDDACAVIHPTPVMLSPQCSSQHQARQASPTYLALAFSGNASRTSSSSSSSAERVPLATTKSGNDRNDNDNVQADAQSASTLYAFV